MDVKSKEEEYLTSPIRQQPLQKTPNNSASTTPLKKDSPPRKNALNDEHEKDENKNKENKKEVNKNEENENEEEEKEKKENKGEESEKGEKEEV